jgi:hypothetical protein
MRYIYNLAQSVVVFLGDTWEDRDVAIDFIKRMVANSSLHLDTHVTIRGMEWDSDVLQDALFVFFSSPWFSRTWTVQEFVLAQKVVFYSGTRLLSEHHMRRFISHIRQHLSGYCVQATQVMETKLVRADSSITTEEAFINVLVASIRQKAL